MIIVFIRNEIERIGCLRKCCLVPVSSNIISGWRAYIQGEKWSARWKSRAIKKEQISCYKWDGYLDWPLCIFFFPPFLLLVTLAHAMFKFFFIYKKNS
jgi:hypothetical protein